MPIPKPASSERRAALLDAGARVSKNITSILDPDELLRQTVDIICDEFEFYYAGVFLLDEAGKYAVLRAGRGEAGAAMMAAGHRLEVGGNSMIGAATDQREARIALDVGEEAVHFKNPHLPNTRSEMALPLIAGDEVIGALTVQSEEEVAFSQEDITALQAMADQLAVAIQNSRLHNRVQALLSQAERRATLLEAANKVGHEVASILDLDTLLPKTVDIICDSYGFYYAGVFLLDEKGEWAVLAAGRGEAGRVMIAEGHKLEVGGNSMIGAATAQHEARIALDVGEEAVHFKNPHLPHTRSEMALPLIAGYRVLGAVTVQSVEERAFSEDDIRSLQTMADHLAIAIHNAQVLGALERANAELVRARVYEALATATTEAIHWMGNKALPMTTTADRMLSDLSAGEVDAESLQDDLELLQESARMIVAIKENLIGPARERQPRAAHLADVVQAAAFHAGVPQDMLTVDQPADAPMALVDTTQLARALGNLLRNAMEANAGHITVTISPEADDYISVSIADDGDGVAPDVSDKMWAAFYTTRGGDHTGLGLAACLHVVSQLDGRIMVESEPGQGATFMIVLPASATFFEDADFSAAPDNILLIDDADQWTEFVVRILDEAGKRIECRANTDGAADADLILVDETLTAMPIADLLADLKGAGAIEKTIIVSAAVYVERATEYLQAGVKDIVLKPYSPGELAEILG